MQHLTLKELRDKLQKGETTAVEAVQKVFAQIRKHEPVIKAYLQTFEQAALGQAQKADELLKKSGTEARPAPLLGVPLAVKDNLNLLNTETTCASKILRGYVSPYTATAVQKLIEAGAIIIGKTNLDEFAMGSSTENSAIQQTSNPWDTGRVPGGSSGGAAAAVAADECFGGLGSDTGGSIRQPAAFCGIVGLKPTYGLVSRYGLVAFASSLDQIGPLAKTVEDAAIILNVIAGYDAADSTSHARPPQDYTALLGQDIKGKKIALIKELLGDGIADTVRQAVETAADNLRTQGAVIETVSLPTFQHALAAYYLVATSEASANLARFDGVRFGYRQQSAKNVLELFKQSRAAGFGAEVKRRIMLGTYALSAGYYDAYYLKAQKIRTLIKQDYCRAFAQYDALISPTAPTAAFKFGEKVGSPLSMYLSDIATIPVNLAGLPGISVPCGLADGLPVGLQLVAAEFEEQKLLQIAAAVERGSKFARIRL
ncbi:aspartyl/glutamyl-tRNA amidotransferase subunit A [Candidatus Termititenax persephonae]|uniref:Glutamyl-tRNA(Gln) amidotransferase subunit A n=1 Tax=Candidatus Termititenax persephonae TaxID=2218525 RepID=A0A388TFT4_9BACT|nr:aspartyl/glutamyl-tRNA amidotransferase subunit A [Candidatus Termititenax persephonae]